MKKLKISLFIALLVLLFIEVWLGFPLQLENKADFMAPTGLAGTELPVDKRMQGVHYVESRSGNRDWELFSEVAEEVSADGSWQLKNVKVHFFSNDKLEFTVVGKEGRIDNQSKNIKINGDVMTQSRNGYRFATKAVNYLSKNRVLQSEGKVYLSSPADSQGSGIKAEGDFLEAFVDQDVMRMKNKVIAKKDLNNGKKFVVKSGTAEFSGNNKTVRFFEHVNIEVDTMKMEGPEANFQYGRTDDFLQSIIVKGGVRVSDIDKYATSEMVNFDPASNRFTLSGNPRVVQNDDEIAGERIEFIDGGKKVKVDNMKARVEKLKE